MFLFGVGIFKEIGERFPWLLPFKVIVGRSRISLNEIDWQLLLVESNGMANLFIILPAKKNDNSRYQVAIKRLNRFCFATKLVKTFSNLVFLFGRFFI